MNTKTVVAASVLAVGLASAGAKTLFGASGDPYVRWKSEPVALTSGQRTTLINHIKTRWPTVELADIERFECESDTRCTWSCRPLTRVTATGEQIRAQLLAGQAWVPQGVASKQLTEWPWYCYNNSQISAVRTFAANVAPETADNPLISALFERSNGDIVATFEYKRGMSAADCETYQNKVLLPMGIQP